MQLRPFKETADFERDAGCILNRAGGAQWKSRIDAGSWTHDTGDSNPSNEVTSTGRSGGSAAFTPQKLVLTMVPAIAANLKREG